MSVDLSQFFSETASGILVPLQLRKQLFPWEALQALNPPTGFVNVSPDVLTTMSAMVAQGPRAPAMLTADEHGVLKVGAEINQTSTVGRPQNVGDNVVMVTDPTFVGPGDVFLVFSKTLGAIQGPYQVSSAGQDVDGTIHLNSGLTAAVASGDGVRRLPLAGISTAANTVVVGNATNGQPLAVKPVQGTSFVPIVPTGLAGTSVGAVGTTTVIAGVAAQNIFVWGCFLEVTGQTGGTTEAVLQDALTGQLLLSISIGPLENNGQATINHGGVPLSLQAACQLFVVSIGTAATVRCTVGFAQQGLNT